MLDFRNLKKIAIEKLYDFHLAAQSIVSNASKKPFDSYITNIIVWRNLEACARSKHKLVIIITMINVTVKI